MIKELTGSGNKQLPNKIMMLNNTIQILDMWVVNLSCTQDEIA